jgi:hypothetical protein
MPTRQHWADRRAQPLVYSADCVWNAWTARKSAIGFAGERMPKLKEHSATPDGSARFLIYYRLDAVESPLALAKALGLSGASPHQRLLRPSPTTS